MMRSPSTADFCPPVKARDGVHIEMVPTWAAIAERYEPGDEAQDRAVVSMLARAHQDALPELLRRKLVEHARETLTIHVPDEGGACVPCSKRHKGFHVPYPCWGVLLARRVVPAADLPAAPTAPSDRS